MDDPISFSGTCDLDNNVLQSLIEILLRFVLIEKMKGRPRALKELVENCLVYQCFRLQWAGASQLGKAPAAGRDRTHFYPCFAFLTVSPPLQSQGTSAIF